MNYLYDSSGRQIGRASYQDKTIILVSFFFFNLLRP